MCVCKSSKVAKIPLATFCGKIECEGNCDMVKGYCRNATVFEYSSLLLVDLLKVKLEKQNNVMK